MENVSDLVLVGFVLTVFATLWFFYKATKSTTALLIILSWMGVTAVLGLTGFYTDFNAVPPRFVFLLGPGILSVIIFAFIPKGKAFMQAADIKWLTLLHCVRVPVELVLYYVYLAGLIPDLMTFEGYNFDIISGITAPVVYYFYVVKKQIHAKLLLAWNFLCLGLLANIATIAVLSAKTPFQQLAFNQPNIGVAYFPLVWLPAVIVPMVFFSHIASIMQLLNLKK